MTLLALGVCGSGWAEESARTSLSDAAALAAAGRGGEAQEVLRAARETYRDTPLYPEVLLQSGRLSLALGDGFRGRFFLGEAVRLAPGSSAGAEAARHLGDLLYADRRWAEAYASYDVAERGSTLDPGGRAFLNLRLAEISQLELADVDRAREHLARVSPALLAPKDRDLYAILLSRARWEHWPASRLGLEDPNISALTLDEDDLWVGTWSGGLARVERSSGATSVFRGGADSLVANTVRAICVTARHVWVGTDQGLSQYSKALSVWRTVADFAGSTPRKVQAIREVGGVLYVATLGDGLWSLRGETWSRVGDPGLSTAYITALGETGGELLVGTMDAGLWRIRDTGLPGQSILRVPGVSSRNITAILGDRSRVWVGTYGEGVWSWDPGADRVTRYRVATGELDDDWVMAVASAGEVTYFGTFGGGVSYVGGDGRWERLGLAEGLASLDVLAILAAGDEVWFGTLGAGVSVFHRLLGRQGS